MAMVNENPCGPGASFAVQMPDGSLRRATWCRVCGVSCWPAERDTDSRCDRHQGRNPCAIEGCHRSRPAPSNGELGLDQVICGRHWRALIPARSRARRAYHAHFRRAKRQGGWSYSSVKRFYRFWDSLVALARRRAASGHIDIAAIEREFGA